MAALDCVTTALLTETYAKSPSTSSFSSSADLDGYWDEFYEIFGFGIDGVDYDADVAIQIPIPSLDE